MQPIAADSVFAGLTPKQRAFCVAYLANGFNATQAAREAGYSAKTAESQGCRLLKNVKVAAVLAARTKERLARREITADNVLDELAKLAFFDPRKLFNAYGSLIPVQELGDEEAAAVAGIDVKLLRDTSTLTKIKLADKGQSLERLGRHLKLFNHGPAGTSDDPLVVEFKSILSGERKP